jgi:hypothetical protein
MMAVQPIEEKVTRHDFWRACYATMLSELKPNEIVEFFAGLPMQMGGRNYIGLDLLAHLWSEKGSISLNWNYAAVNALEPFLVEKGYDALAFMRKMLFRNNKSTYMPGKIVMSWVYPIMDKIFNLYDPREMIFQMIEIYTENYLPGHIHPKIKKKIDKEWTYSYLMYLADGSIEKFPNFNFDYIAGEQIKGFPRMLNLPEFENITYLADCRSLEKILWEPGVEFLDKVLVLNGQIIGERKKFREFSFDHGLEIQKYTLPDNEIVVATEDIFCSKRKRVVVYKGCAYGSLVFISVVKHRKIPNSEKKFLEHMLVDTLLDGDLFSAEVKVRHENLMASFTKKNDFVYRASDESISLNGDHFIKGVSAKILRKIIVEYVTLNRKNFEYRNFKQEFEISLGQKNSNFEVRFYRLMDALDSKCPEFKIEKTERGKFLLTVTGKIEFKEL